MRAARFQFPFPQSAEVTSRPGGLLPRFSLDRFNSERSNPTTYAGEAASERIRNSEDSASSIVMQSIVKRYGSILANDDVSITLHPGEIHALLGENGAGKSTLMKILFGMVAPDSGFLTVDDSPVVFKSPRDALTRRIGMVHQHFLLVPQFSVAENVVLGSQPSWKMRLRKSQIEREVTDVAGRFGMEIDATRRVGGLSIDVQQRVEILKLLYRGAKTLILDEPTAALGPAEVAKLFASLRALRNSGHSIVIITHKLREVMEIADCVTVLRHGRVVSAADRGNFNENDLAQAMVGHSLTTIQTLGNPPDGDPRLRVTDLTVSNDRGVPALDHISFDVRPGEIVGMAGVEGNGQVELAQCLGGLRAVDGGHAYIDGRDCTHADPRDLHRRGVSIITEDRLEWDLIADLTVAENLALSRVTEGRHVRYGMLHRRSIRQSAEDLIRDYDVSPPIPDMRAGSLSGGNQQKVVLAREIARNPRVLIVAQPTRGLDVAAAEFVQRRLLKLRDDGCAILLFGQDLSELLALSDRVLVLYRGRIAYADSASTISIDNVARAMAGMQVTA